MKKKVVVLGGGTGSSTLVRGLKEFPVDLTAIVSVCDDGSSTGVLREEFGIPAVGDIRRVLVALSETEPLVMELFNYRFHTLIGKMEDNTIIEGEHNITANKSQIKRVFYKEEPVPTKEAVKAIEDAELIILSMGSLFTSIIPNLICDEIRHAIDRSQGKVMYVCNMVTQPGETEKFTVSDHVKLLNQYLGEHKVDVVIANSGKIDDSMARRYESLEQKDPVVLDMKETEKLVKKVVCGDYVTIKNNLLRHNVMKLGLDIFGYLLEQKA